MGLNNIVESYIVLPHYGDPMCPEEASQCKMAAGAMKGDTWLDCVAGSSVGIVMLGSLRHSHVRPQVI